MFNHDITSLVPFADRRESALARRPRPPLEHVREAPLRQPQLLPQSPPGTAEEEEVLAITFTRIGTGNADELFNLSRNQSGIFLCASWLLYICGFSYFSAQNVLLRDFDVATL